MAVPSVCPPGHHGQGRNTHAQPPRNNAPVNDATDSVLRSSENETRIACHRQSCNIGRQQDRTTQWKQEQDRPLSIFLIHSSGPRQIVTEIPIFWQVEPEGSLSIASQSVYGRNGRWQTRTKRGGPKGTVPGRNGRDKRRQTGIVPHQNFLWDKPTTYSCLNVKIPFGNSTSSGYSLSKFWYGTIGSGKLKVNNN